MPSPETPQSQPSPEQLANQIKEQKEHVKELALKTRAIMQEKGKESEEYRTANAILGQAMETTRQMVQWQRELKNPIEKPTPESPETQEIYEQAEKLFGENFLGIEQVETAFTIQDEDGKDLKLIDLTPEEQEKAKELLKQKLEEPDIQVFLRKLENKELNPGDYMLVFRMPTIKLPDHRDGSRRKVPVTMQDLRFRLSEDMERKGQGKLLDDITWCETESFYRIQQPGNTATTAKEVRESLGEGAMHWQIVTKEVLPDSTDKNYAAQAEVLSQAAVAIGLNETKVVRRKPVEIVYDFLTVLRRDPKNQERILLGEFDWGGVRSSSGRHVIVGRGDSDGLVMDGWHPDRRGGGLGASLSR